MMLGWTTGLNSSWGVRTIRSRFRLVMPWMSRTANLRVGGTARTAGSPDYHASHWRASGDREGDAVETGIEAGRRACEARDERGGLLKVGALGHLHFQHVAA